MLLSLFKGEVYVVNEGDICSERGGTNSNSHIDKLIIIF